MSFLKRLSLLIAIAFLGIAATAANLDQLYFMATTLLMLPLVSLAIGRLNLRGLSFERETPAVAWEGDTVPFSLNCRSTGRTSRLLIQAMDAPTRWIEPDGEPPTFHVPANGEAQVEYRCRLLKRGLHRIDGLLVLSPDPLGLWSFSMRYPLASEVLVYPRPQRIPNVLLTGAERFGYRDMPITAARGAGVDFDGVREYVPGDPLRRMHWKSYARTGRLNIVEYEESRAVNLVLALDLQAGSNIGAGPETTLEYLIRAAASIAQLGIRQGAVVRLAAGPDPDPANFSGRGTDHLFTILSCLARAEADDPDPLATRLVERVGRIPAGASLIVFTCTPDPELIGALLHYTTSGAHTILVYADPRSFAATGRLPSDAEQSRFLRSAASIGCVPLLLQRRPDGLIDLQQAQDTSIGSILFSDD